MIWKDGKKQALGKRSAPLGKDTPHSRRITDPRLSKLDHGKRLYVEY